jgi:hypothetical protein
VVRARELDVERINQFSFYELGQNLSKIAAFETRDASASAAFWPIWEANTALKTLLSGKPIPLGVSKARAQELSDIFEHIVAASYRTTLPDGSTQMRFPQEGDPAIPGWRFYQLKEALTAFEMVFREEMREAATYYVPRRGIYFTPALVDSADDSFPAELLSCLPPKTRVDWRAAGRCLAFMLLSASGFHVTRAVEGMLEAYYQLFSGQPGKTLHSWNEYIQELETIAKGNPTPCPAKKTLAELRQMKDDYRNPIAHPRVVLGEPDARMLFANGESLIIAMAQEIAEVRKSGVQPTLLGLVTPPAVTAGVLTAGVAVPGAGS